ncbi:GmrSD restriction endonuclease domain-containing protein [Brachybacterium squillarum]|uniref:GmrSD restriction endonuclease domain-containing protein n=1 Tax=Brachybacterium squillarum TaxID=661979 RepID=UPI0002629903|nr:DUF1524 domain-containing protein [Brachybacterium squillarum]
MTSRLPARVRSFSRGQKIGLGALVSCCGCSVLAVLLIIALGVLGAVLDAEDTVTAPAPTATSSAASDDGEPTPTPDTSTALGVLAALEVKGRAPKTGYERDLFGWRQDVDGNGCDTRNDVLRRDLRDILLVHGTQGCVVLSGELATSPYSGDAVDFVKQDDPALDIDHVVALSDAWQTGADSWDEQTRHAFANDPLNLLAVEDDLNSQKGDGDAATWLPPNSGYRCEYVARQIAVKEKYELWVKPAEVDAMTEVLTDCPEQPAFADDQAVPAPGEGEGAREEPSPTPEPEPTTEEPEPTTEEPEPTTEEPEPTTEEPEPTTQEPEPSTEAPAEEESEDDGGSVYYENCDAVRAAGADPIMAGDPGYSRKLDRDGDGIGCE